MYGDPKGKAKGVIYIEFVKCEGTLYALPSIENQLKVELHLKLLKVGPPLAH